MTRSRSRSSRPSNCWRCCARSKISALELADEYIRQIERLNPQINALVDFDPERVREQARAIDGASGSLGPLAGLPVTVKSSISTAGYRCEIGSLVNKGSIPRQRCDGGGALAAAGAVILGTTNCPEYLMAYVTDNLSARPHQQSLEPRLHARRIQRRRVGGHRSRNVRGRTWAATAAARCACRRTSPASARSSRRRDAFRAMGTCHHASARSRFSARSAPWRAPSTM